MTDATKPRWFALPLLALGALGFASAWILVALRFDRQFAWLAPLAAADMVLLLTASHWPAGHSRALAAMLGTLATIILTVFGIVAGQVGMGMGMRPWESALKLGPNYASELARLATPASDLAWYALGIAVAMVAGFRTWTMPKGTPPT